VQMKNFETLRKIYEGMGYIMLLVVAFL
jgi:hypothetical protein